MHTISFLFTSHPTTLSKSDNKELGDGFYSYNVQESYQFHWYSYYGEQYGSSLKNKKIRLLAILFLGIYLEKTAIEKILEPQCSL